MHDTQHKDNFFKILSRLDKENVKGDIVELGDKKWSKV